MLYENAKVVAQDQHYLWVETLQKSACGSCQAAKGCGQRLLHSAFRSSTVLRVKRPSHAEGQAARGATHDLMGVGDRVVLAVDENKLVLAALSSYGLPLLALLIFCAFSNFVFGSELVNIGFAVVGLLLGALCVRVMPVRLEASVEIFDDCSAEHAALPIPPV